ncbi:hypothetical protein KI387_025901, partial [Taxus chinensis]
YKLSAKFKRSEISEIKEPNSCVSVELFSSSPDHQELQSLSHSLLVGLEASDSPSPRTSEIRSENEIDKIAGSFIRRFHNQMRLQKQDSYNAMLARS